MVTGPGVNFDLLVPRLGLSHQQVGASRLAERVVLTVQHEQRERDGLEVTVDILQTSANTNRTGHVMS